MSRKKQSPLKLWPESFKKLHKLARIRNTSLVEAADYAFTEALKGDASKPDDSKLLQEIRAILLEVMEDKWL